MTLMRYSRRFNCVDLLLIGYLVFTFVYISFFFHKIPSAGLHLLARILFLGIIFYIPQLEKKEGKPVPEFLRVAYPLIFLSFFYSETDALNNVFFQDLDYHFARFDAIVFGFQPSLAFYSKMPYAWFSELMNFSYFSYYFLIAAYSIYVFINDKTNFTRTIFYITCSFLIYYIIFMIIPVSGPQYFFEPPHNKIPDSGVFRFLVRFVEWIGERPTAAFPSSHVGMVLILILMAWPGNKKTWLWLMPFFVFLSMSTVYIKAHYAVDVIGGIISAPVVLWLSKLIFTYFNKQDFLIPNKK